MNNNIFTAGSCGSDSCGCLTHEDKLTLGDTGVGIFTAGSCGSDSCGCLTHKDILVA